MSDVKRERDTVTGQYIHEERWERLCVCGHTLGNHTAASHGGRRPCIECDFTPGVVCDCSKFRAVRRKK